MIKAVPEDFIVQEKADLPLRKNGEYRVYLLKKSHWNTLDLIHFLSRSLRLPLQKFSYGGKKDKHGLTHQFIAIQEQSDYTQEGKNFSLESQGFTDRPMGPDLIQGNSFTITMRDLTDLDSLERNIDEVMKTGFPNFFDDQRFRSLDPEKGFFAERILKRHWNGALQVYLTSTGPDSGKRERERKKALFESWKDWPACLNYAQGPLEQKIFGYLAQHPEDFARALHLLPQEEISMLYAAFQSHLWNEVLRRVLRIKIKELAEIKGVEGSYLFWQNINKDTFIYLNGLEISTPAAKMEFPDELIRSLCEEVLKEKNLKPGSFRTKVLRKVYFRSFKRKAITIPDGLRIVNKGDDDLHPAKKKMTVSFFLPRGAYGTMLVKRINLKLLTGISH
jgi:tRNA pseudouridine13 synthase